MFLYVPKDTRRQGGLKAQQEMTEGNDEDVDCHENDFDNDDDDDDGGGGDDDHNGHRKPSRSPATRRVYTMFLSLMARSPRPRKTAWHSDVADLISPRARYKVARSEARSCRKLLPEVLLALDSFTRFAPQSYQF